MKTILRTTSGVLALSSLLLAGYRMNLILEQGGATIKDMMGLIFPLSVALMFGYMAIKGIMPFMDEQTTSPSENPPQESP